MVIGASRWRTLVLGPVLCLMALAPRPTQSATVPPLYREKLPNGMHVVLMENHRNPLVALYVIVKAGSMYETPRINGISHFFEHLFFRGTTTRTGEEFKRDIESLGGQFNAETTKDFTKFHINLPSQYARQGLDLLSDALEHAGLRPADVNLERQAVLDEYRIDLESPGAILDTMMYSLMFQQHPYRMSIIGDEKSIKGITIEDLREYRRKWYIPSRTSLVIVGDVTPKEIMPAVREYFGPFSGSPTGSDAVPPEPDSHEVREHVEHRSLNNAFVMFGFHSPSVRDRPDVYRADVLTFLLGQGDGSLLNQRLVEEQKIALSASCDFLTQRDPGLITMTASAQPSKVDRVRAAILGVVKSVRDGKFTDADFQRARNLLRNTYVFGNETNDGKADGLAFYAAIDNVDFALSYLDEVNRVTKADVVAAARKYLDLDDYGVLVIRSPDGRASADE